ncbi:uncharacterized protein LOC111610143 [Xiphophorus maculatus]|uniref:uncharacterized protein LOC111610143 n=1 Tax=Xiphophorus maculatus TaxID=8083 RepID=UPI000C6DEAB2|nr:uncharacterized protein LOC111610143 [Xiphophorus maculatus]
MITVFIIFAAFVATALAKESIECKFYDSTGTQQCHGAEGQQLHFHLSKTKIIDFRLTKNGEYILLITYSNGKVDLKGQYVSQFEEIRPGTFSLGNAMKEHSGVYRLEEYDAAGQEMRNVQVHVKIQKPVSKPAVSQKCFSPDQRTVTCSSYGDEVEFLLTLDGHSLIQSRGIINNCTDEKFNVTNVCISIYGQLTGGLRCQVWNKVSRKNSGIHLTACKGSGSFIVPVLAAATAVFLVVLGFIVIRFCKKRRPMPQNRGHAEEEIIYADVKVRNDTRTEPNIRGKAK